MLLKRSSGRGSTYAQKIDPITLHIAYEGKQDEKEYFDAFSISLKKRYRKMVKLVPVPKSSTRSTPEVVKNDLVQHLKRNKINLLKTKSHLGFIVIDKDHFFDNQHQASTWQAIGECSQRGISVICSNPCFEVWLLCHYLDISQQSDEFKRKAIANRKANKNSKTFLKAQVAKYRNNETIDKLISRIPTAYHNEILLKQQARKPDNLPPDELVSNIGLIVKIMLDNGVPLFD
ncbi:RloB family protein [Vibrio vulnificus]|nr:RloB domain-containing protein [Vibrio vulnificus]EHZ2753652.1 RloB domain-containing protein [Vibrio vulnificus]EHZ2762586.1 RloB domain-containing protein [Vibrio vulnificus]EKD8802515.1 RloB domain-containing protein [Vibrio vulnificus]EKD9320891.1 RloB domain-containing protein [Vibrio vulnificus]